MTQGARLGTTGAPHRRVTPQPLSRALSGVLCSQRVPPAADLPPVSPAPLVQPIALPPDLDAVDGESLTYSTDARHYLYDTGAHANMPIGIQFPKPCSPHFKFVSYRRYQGHL